MNKFLLWGVFIVMLVSIVLIILIGFYPPYVHVGEMWCYGYMKNQSIIPVSIYYVDGDNFFVGYDNYKKSAFVPIKNVNVVCCFK